MSEIEALPIKYIYLDVVGFTYNSTVEAQTGIIASLNRIVKEAVSSKIPNEAVIYIPVGDGICISIMGSKKYDDHIRIAENIIRRIESIHNKAANQTRKFHIRIGVNESVDNVIVDINGSKNVCGAGVNFAQRIMSFADASQVLVGRATYDNLRYREKYSKSFRSYHATAKHNVPLELYQYIGGNVAALNRDGPSHFATIETTRKLSKYVAYYIAHAIKNRRFIDSHLQHDYDQWPLALLLAYLAEDSVGHSQETRVYNYTNKMPDTENDTLEEQFQVFDEMPVNQCGNLFEYKVEIPILQRFRDCFEPSAEGLFVNDTGQTRLKSDWPNIYTEFKQYLP
jgi:class 3 adenylate cyclase